MASCLLFHGPGARGAVLYEANRIGKLVAPPFGDGGLKMAEAREFVSLMSAPLVGGAVGVVVAGPLDQAPPGSSDVLLKSIEEFDPQVVYPLVWAYDLGGVAKTIRSRCLDRWCPNAPVKDEDDNLIEKAAFSMVAVALAKQPWKLAGLLKPVLKDESVDEETDKKEKTSEKLVKLVDTMAGALMSRLSEPEAQQLYLRLREVARWWNPTPPEILAAMLPEV